MNMLKTIFYSITLFALYLPPISSQATNTNSKTLNKVLKGQYGFTIYRSCISTPGTDGFDKETGSLLMTAENLAFVDSGIFYFDGKGNIKTLETKIIQMFIDQLNVGDTPVTPNLVTSCQGTYDVKANKSQYSFEIDCEADLGNNLTLNISTFKSEGYIGFKRKMLTTNEISGNIQTFKISQGEHVIQENERICTTSGTLIKLRKN